jgi:hypothetical protein
VFSEITKPLVPDEDETELLLTPGVPHPPEPPQPLTAEPQLPLDPQPPLVPLLPQLPVPPQLPLDAPRSIKAIFSVATETGINRLKDKRKQRVTISRNTTSDGPFTTSPPVLRTKNHNFSVFGLLYKGFGTLFYAIYSQRAW